MLHSMTGTVLASSGNTIILDNGHNCSFVIWVLDEDRTPGFQGRFYVHFYMRQEQFTCFGFKDEHTSCFFKKLIQVKGCGPKTALNILNYMKVDAVVEAIETENRQALESMPGIGKRMASQLILDLKGRLNDFIRHRPTPYEVSGIIQSLMAMGYPKVRIEQVLSQIDLNYYHDEGSLLKALLKGMREPL